MNRPISACREEVYTSGVVRSASNLGVVGNQIELCRERAIASLGGSRARSPQYTYTRTCASYSTIMLETRSSHVLGYAILLVLAASASGKST